MCHIFLYERTLASSGSSVVSPHATETHWTCLAGPKDCSWMICEKRWSYLLCCECLLEQLEPKSEPVVGFMLTATLSEAWLIGPCRFSLCYWSLIQHWTDRTHVRNEKRLVWCKATGTVKQQNLVYVRLMGNCLCWSFVSLRGMRHWYFIQQLLQWYKLWALKWGITYLVKLCVFETRQKSILWQQETTRYSQCIVQHELFVMQQNATTIREL